MDEDIKATILMYLTITDLYKISRVKSDFTSVLNNKQFWLNYFYKHHKEVLIQPDTVYEWILLFQLGKEYKREIINLRNRGETDIMLKIERKHYGRL